MSIIGTKTYVKS